MGRGTFQDFKIQTLSFPQACCGRSSSLALTNHPAATRLLGMFLILKWEPVTLRLTRST